MAAIKIFVKEEGWYRVTQPELAAGGLNAGVNPKTLQLFVDGMEQPILVAAANPNQFGPQDAIEFYATGLDTRWTDTRAYWLIAGNSYGKRIGTSTGKGTQGALSFPFTVEKKDREIYVAAAHNGDAENFFGALIAPNAPPAEELVELLHLDTSRAATLAVTIQGLTSGAHAVDVLFNGTSVGQMSFNGQTSASASFAIPQSELIDGDNYVSLESMAGDMDYSGLDSIRVTYWHTFTADNDSLKLTAQNGKKISKVSVSGFTNPNIRVVDVTYPAATTEVKGTVSTNGSDYSVTFTAPGAGNRTLLAFTREKIKTAAGVAANQPSSWSKSGAHYDMVMISHGSFLANLALLRGLRESQGLSVALVDVEDLYDEFSYGAKSAQAIRDFLSLTYAQGNAPRFVAAFCCRPR